MLLHRCCYGHGTCISYMINFAPIISVHMLKLQSIISLHFWTSLSNNSCMLQIIFVNLPPKTSKSFHFVAFNMKFMPLLCKALIVFSFQVWTRQFD